MQKNQQVKRAAKSILDRWNYKYQLQLQLQLVAIEGRAHLWLEFSGLSASAQAA